MIRSIPACLSLVLTLTVALGVLAPPAGAQAKKKKRVNPVFAPVEDDPKLPRVLIIGDSISIGYTLATRKELEGVANVHRPPTNCGPTTRGLEHIDSWLGDPDKKWDVIHFNWGLHDLKHCDENGKLVDVGKGKIQVPIEEYEANLDKLVTRMKKTGATLIWRNTTPVPQGARGRVPGDSAKYNAAAAKVMKKHGVQTHDLFTFAKEREKQIQRPANVHYTPEGSKLLAKEVAKVIKAALTK